ncbi:hypothetical protein Q0Z83_055740 [Actinoplanes sichuanensis]|nr:hypothetical protein Q0Z83_055740 [Actinoplanes sichuanensis]
MVPRTDVSRWGYPAVLINLGVVVLDAALLLLDTRLPAVSSAPPDATAAVAPRPGSVPTATRGDGFPGFGAQEGVCAVHAAVAGAQTVRRLGMTTRLRTPSYS